jgi:hypothetical protein
LERIALAPKYFDVVADGRKTTTIRYGHRDYKTGKVQFYCDICGRQQDIFITNVQYKKFSEITDDDALTDGYLSADELKAGLLEFYPNIHIQEQRER